MNKESFRLIVGVSVIVVHFTCFIIIFYGKNAYLSPPQKIDIALLFMPITAAYVVAIVRAAVDNPGLATATAINLNYAVIVFLITAITMLGLLWTVATLSGNMESDRQQISIFEIVFGAAFGLVAADLFGKVERVQVSANRPPKKPGN